jgi:hypothetical protein
LVQDEDQWRDVVNTIRNFRVPLLSWWGISWVAKLISASLDRSYYMGLVIENNYGFRIRKVHRSGTWSLSSENVTLQSGLRI